MQAALRPSVPRTIGLNGEVLSVAPEYDLMQYACDCIPPAPELTFPKKVSVLFQKSTIVIYAENEHASSRRKIISIFSLSNVMEFL